MILALCLLGCAIYPKVESFMSNQVTKSGLERRSVLVDGGSMYYWEGGNPSGEPLLWLHGFGGDALWAWSRNLHDFADTHHIIAPDLLWFGDSQGGLTLDAQAAAVQKVLEAEGVDTAHVLRCLWWIWLQTGSDGYCFFDGLGWCRGSRLAGR